MKRVLQRWQKRALYGRFAVSAFLFALRHTFPIDAGQGRLASVEMTGVSLESREGLRIPIERLDATVRLRSLLFGRRGTAFDAALFEGRVKGFAEDGKTARRIAATISGVD